VKGSLVRVGERWYPRSALLKIEYHRLFIEKITSKVCSQVDDSSSSIEASFEVVLREIARYTGSMHPVQLEVVLWIASLIFHQPNMKPRSPELWQGPSSGLDLSNYASESLIIFHKENFCTVRGPALNRHQRLCGYEIQVLNSGVNPQFGFCTEAFKQNFNAVRTGCGDDSLSWAWDGVRHRFWFTDSRDIPEITWTIGDILTFECDFSCNTARLSINGVRVHEHAFSSDTHVIYPAMSGQGDRVMVNFGSKPFRFLKTSRGSASEAFVKAFEQACFPESPFIMAMRIILGKLLCRFLIQDGQLCFSHELLSEEDFIAHLPSSLWFTGNKCLQDAAAEFFYEAF